jgi:membrane associated rhomboid family serine protease
MRTSSFGFPPFTPAVKKLVYINLGVFFLLLVLGATAPDIARSFETILGLLPQAVLHGFIWQLVTYSFIHAGILHILFNMLALWMFGSTLEQDWGSRRFLEFYFFCVVGAALTTILMSYTHLLGMSPAMVTVGASGGIYGLIVAFGILYAEARIYIYGIFPIKAKWFAIIWVALAALGALQDRGSIANIAHLGGALFGYVYLKMMPRRGMQFAVSEGYFGLRNRYHKWKRRQAAKKFEVYMRQHDRNEYFDEHGNYRDPNEAKRKDNGQGGSGKWVN